MTIIIFFIGWLGLLAGAELLVRGASRLGLTFGLSPLVVGLTIVAFGTSSPEVAVGLKAALSGQSDIVIGTCLGSTIFNILFILGLSALITPLAVTQQLVWYEVPIMIGAHLLFFALAFDGTIDRLDAFILLVALMAYTLFAIVKGRKETLDSVKKEYEEAMPSKTLAVGSLSTLKNLGYTLAGLGLCVWGAGWLLDSAVIIARALGVSDLVIAITVVAAGTSFPELATSVVAALRGEKDIAIGNVVGSNIFNILGIIGVAGLAVPDGIRIAPAVLRFDFPVALAACIACLPLFFTGHKISRWEGGLFFGYYIAYTAYLILSAQQHDLLPIFSSLMLWFVMPLTLLTLTVVLWREIYKKAV